MTEYSKIASESMKQLTEQIIKADLASRKRRNISIQASKLGTLVWGPIILYVFYVRNFLKKLY
jgi:hypothetical protein